MKNAVVITFFAVIAAAAAAGDATPVAYRFDDVRRTVTLTSAKQQVPAVKGLAANSGDKVHTGWFAYALIAAEASRARFEIFSMSDVELAGGTPGVLLSVERGRIRAIFDKITGSEPRVVKTPGALLAVRGTEFDVEVDKNGRTTVDVWEGVVEVRSDVRPEPLMLRAGEQSIFGRREPPTAHPMPEERRRNAPGNGPGDRGGQQPGGPHMQPPMGDPRGPSSKPPSQPPSMMPPRTGTGTGMPSPPPATGTHH